MASVPAIPPDEAVPAVESQKDANDDNDTQSVSLSGSESPCDPYLSFDGTALEFLDLGSQVPAVKPRSVPSSDNLAKSIAESLETDSATLLPALQTKGNVFDDDYQPVHEDEQDPASFDLIAPSTQTHGVWSLEKRSELLLSKEHMGAIIGNSRLLRQFTQFLSSVRPASIPLLTYYLDTEKALKAINYANAVVATMKLDGHDFATGVIHDTSNSTLQAKRDAAFEALVRDELPMFVTHVWIQTVSLSIKRRIVGTMPMQLRDASEGLAEVFCITDPSRQDNPIILASDEFHRTTQYGIDYVIGRNCRFLQGPGTNPFSVRRIRARLAAGQEHYETILNYRRDGSPFLNLVLCAPLIDSRGSVRYFLGAQVDVSGLAKECAGLEGLRHVVEAEEHEDKANRVDESVNNSTKPQQQKGLTQCCRDLSEMLDRNELDTARRHGGFMHEIGAQRRKDRQASNMDTQAYMFIEDDTSPEQSPPPSRAGAASDVVKERLGVYQGPNGRLTGVYTHYLLVRPAPSLRVLFASPSLRFPGILQSPFLSRIGGSGRVRNRIARAFDEGHGVTAKVQWLPSGRRVNSEPDYSRARWLHCTPLRGVNASIGIWMVVIVDDDD